MAKIGIDLDQLALALSDHESEWVLDRETGQVIMPDWVRYSEFAEEFGLEVDADGDVDYDAADELLDSGRFIRIDPIESHESFRWMERFARSQPEERVRERLLGVLNRDRPFRRFKDALHAFPEVRDAWYLHEDEKLKEAAREWLEYHEIEFVAVPPPDAPGAPHADED